MTGRARLVARLAARDLRRRPVEALLLLAAIAAATTTLALGLSVRGLADDPYRVTSDATSGPDVVATVGPPTGAADEPDPAMPPDLAAALAAPADLDALEELARADGVVDHSGPFPVVGAELAADGVTVDVQAVGRDVEPASVDQPMLTDGGWVREGGVVVEAAFAAAQGLGVGDVVAIDGRPFDLVGIAVTAAAAPFPEASCFSACMTGATPAEDDALSLPSWVLRNPGLVWVARGDAIALVPDPTSTTWVLNLRLDDPAGAEAFAAAHAPSGPAAVLPVPWQDIREQGAHMERDAQKVLLFGSSLLVVMATATVAVLVGGRIADQGRRIGLLEAVGATPWLVAAVLLAEHAVVALVAAAVGLTAGRFGAPQLTDRGAGLLGTAEPSFGLSTVVAVIAVALAVAALATIVPALRASRTSTLVALADAARAPRRAGRLITLSSRLPTAMLLATRMLSRRPRRAVLGILSVAVTASGLVTVLIGRAGLGEQLSAGGYRAAAVERLWPVMESLMVALAALAAVNIVFIATSTVLDSRRTAAVARVLGATPRQVGVALVTAQLLPALAGALVGVPGGIALFMALDDGTPALPPFWQLATVVPLLVAAIALLVTIPARAGARRPLALALRSERP